MDGKVFDNLTLTRVVFEYVWRMLWGNITCNLTLTRVVFELSIFSCLL